MNNEQPGYEAFIIAIFPVYEILNVSKGAYGLFRLKIDRNEKNNERYLDCLLAVLRQ